MQCLCVFSIQPSATPHAVTALFGPLVHLLQKADKHLLLEPSLGLVNLLDHLDDLVV